MRLTPEQRRAVETPAREVFVSAGAGSGKTSLLVGRYLAAVLEDGYRPESLPTVTFTNRAAAELRDRIRQGLVDGGRSDLAQRLDGAPIGTIHGLCARLLRTSPVEAGVDPGFAVLDQDQAEILLADAWAEVWTGRIRTSSREELDVLGVGEPALTRGIVPLYSALRGLGESLPRFAVSAPESPSSMTRRTVTALEDLRLEAQTCRDVPTTVANREKLDACLEWLRDTPESDQAPADLTCFLPHRGCGSDAKALFVEVIELLERHRELLAEARLAQLAAVADELLQQLHAAYARRKRERGLLDFADLELLALGLVRGGARPFGPEARLMVDEFQDTNGVQCALLNGLGVATVLTVGDAYQSIYGFRGADVDVFRRRDRALESRPAEDVLRTSLLTNFRSRPPVLAVLNHLFSRDEFFGTAFPLLQAGRDDGPRRGRGTAARGTLSPAVEIAVLDLSGPDVAETGAEHRAELEAAHVAERVERLLHDGWRPRDVVVLLRATTHFGAFERALDARLVPTYVIGGRGYYAQDEVADVLALLQLLVNPCDDAALVTVLRSPMVGVSDDALALLRMSAESSTARTARSGVRGAPPGRFLWQALACLVEADFPTTRPGSMPEEDRRSLASFVGRVELLRRRYGRTGLAALLEGALTAFDYDLAILQGRDGRRRFANVMKLLRLAEQYESVDGPDLAGLLAYLKRRSDVGEKEGNAAVLAEDEDVVRVMTIHQAKGLEFPVVIVAGLGVERRRRGSPTFLADAQGRRAVRVRQTKAEGGKGHFSLGPAAAMVEERERREREEEDRLYYVAATRAEERLVLVGTRAPSAGESGSDTDVLSRVLAAVGSGMPVVGEHLRPVDGLDLVVTGLSPVVASPDSPPSPREPGPAPAAPDPMTPRGAATTTGRVSFSALHAYHECPRRYYVERVLGLRLVDAIDASEGPSAPDGPDDPVDALESGGRGPDGRALGVVVHRVLQSLPLDRVPTVEQVDQLVDQARFDSDDGSLAVALDACRELVLGFWRSSLALLPGLAAADQELGFTFAQDGVLVTGVMDVLVRAADHWHVIDYKSNRLGRSAPAEFAQPYLLQQQIYALACLLVGAPRVTVSLLFLERPDEPVVLTFTPDDVRPLREALATSLDGLVRGDFSEQEGPWCAACEAQCLCRVLARSSTMV